MKLRLQHHLTEALEASESDYGALRGLLYFKDPNASSIKEYKDGEWDGMRDFFLDVDQTIFPSGFLNHVLLGLAHQGIRPEIQDDRTRVPLPVCKIEPEMLFGVELRPYQVDAVRAAVEKRRGVINIAPRGGKTEIQIAVAAALDIPSVLCVEKASLMRQHYERFRERGVTNVGRFGDGEKEIEAQHVVATFQSIHSAFRRRDKTVLEWLQQIELAQCDEVHHLGHARTYYRAFCQIPAPYRLGYSGTPFRVVREDESNFHFADFNLMGATGKRITHVTSRFLRDEGYLVEPTVFMVRLTKPTMWQVKHWRNAYKQGVVENRVRNEAIVKIAKMLYDAGERTLVLIKELRHGETLLRMLVEAGVPCIMSSGSDRITTYSEGTGVRLSTGGTQKIREMMESGSLKTVIGSTIYQEGVDIPALSALIVGTAGKDPIEVTQRAFRAMTSVAGKSESYIFDFDDSFNFILRNQSQKRMEIYRQEDIKVVSMLPYKFRRLLGLP